MRCFIAIPIPESEKQVIREALVPFRAAIDGNRENRVSWVRPEGLHITLAFLGEPDEYMYERIRTAFLACDPVPQAFTLRYEGIGWFPARGIPRVLFTDITAGVHESSLLEQTLKKALTGLWRPDRDTFSPHITLGRVKMMKAPPLREKSLVNMNGDFPVDRMVLYESVLRPDGAEYRQLESVQLRR